MSKEIFYCAERTFLEHYLKERASASHDDFKALTDIYGNQINPIPAVGSNEAVNEIYSVEGNIAHIKINGVLSPEGPDLFDRFYGYAATAYGTIRAAMERAKLDSMVSRVIFDVDSPGGSLAGCDETWQTHKALSAIKPTEVHIGSMAASAAYYISAPASKILATTPVSEAGSIGVLVATYDWSKFEENIGIKEVVITSSNAPDKYADVSTAHGIDTIRTRLDAMERIFYSRVAEGRSVTTEHIAEHFGRGGLLVAADPSPEHEDAIRSGMIDGLTADTVEASAGETEEAPSILDELEDFFSNARETEDAPRVIDKEKEKLAIETLRSLGAWPTRLQEFLDQYPSHEGNNTPAPAGTMQEGQAMDLSELLKAHPAAAAEIEKAKAEAKAAGAEEAKAELSATVGRMIGVLTSKSYPDSIKALAGDVLMGKKGIDAYDAAVALFETNTEAENSAAAQAHTQELGPISGEAPSLANTEQKAVDDEWAKSIADAKARAEQAAKEIA